jgi:hypothetical protein
MSSSEESRGEVVIYEAPDGHIALDVRLEKESLWLSQKQISVLFEIERSVITKHLRNIFQSGELERESVSVKFAHTAADGKTYQTIFFNLDPVPLRSFRGRHTMETDTSEAGLESLICEALTGPKGPRRGGTAEVAAAYGSGWIMGDPKDYDREYCVDLFQLRAFLEATQSELPASGEEEDSGGLDKAPDGRVELDATATDANTARLEPHRSASTAEESSVVRHAMDV